MNRSRIAVPKECIADFCRRHGIRELALYGSVLRADFRADSDVDVLVDFEPGKVVGFAILDMEEEFSRLFGGHKVVHDYMHVDFDIVWDVATANVPPLVAQLAALVPPDAPEPSYS